MTEYNTQFKDLLENPLLKETTTPTEPNILELAKVGNKELVISNLYAYFFKPKNNHGLGTIFIESLIEVIRKKGKDFSFNINDKIEVNREVHTSTDKFIDLLLTDDENNAIIIENKLFAHLYNKLEDYTDYVKDYKNIGIILSVYYLKDEIKGFITITHQELYQQIENELVQHKLNLSTRQLANYQSFIEVLKKHYLIMENLKEKIDFFVNNEKSLAKINGQLLDLKTYIMDRVKIITQKVADNSLFEVKYKNLYMELSRKNTPNYILYVCFPSDGDGFDRICTVLCIAGNKELVKKWFLKSSSIYNDLTQELENKEFNCIYKEEEKHKSWALTYFKDIPFNSDDLEKTFVGLDELLHNEWSIIFNKLPISA